MGVAGIHTSYLHFSTQNEKSIQRAAVSPVFITEILKKRLNYQGLVFTDVSNFKDSGKKVRPGTAELLALETGNDVLMAPLNAPAAIKKISKRLKKDKQLQRQVDTSVKKVLGAKYDAGLHTVTTLETDNLLARLNTPEATLLHHRLAEAAVTVVRNEKEFLPIHALEGNSFVSISLGKDAENDFTRYLKKYAEFTTVSIKNSNDTIKISLKQDAVLVVGIFPYAGDLEQQLSGWINRLSAQHPVVIVHFGNPFSIPLYTQSVALVAAYTDQDNLAEIVPQVLFGALPANGVLPVELKDYEYDPRLTLMPMDRLSYSVPEAVDMDSRTLEKIKVIMKEAIDLGATPGCHVIVARRGKVVVDQSAGWLTYENKTAVSDETIYDLASLTKVSATLQACMFMYEKRLFDLHRKVSFFLPELKTTNKKDITVIDMLTHQSGLVPFVPLWPQTVKDSTFLPLYYSNTRSESYPLQVAPGLFATRIIRDSVWMWITKSKMQEKPPRTPYAYRYSDLGFMIMKQMAEKLLNQPMDDFLEQNLYAPLGAYTTGFNPLERFSPDRIAPTEQDKIYRKSLVLGTVHDERAAMLGGVSGHAGLFSTANDLAKLGQMLLQEGHYGGETYYQPETVRYFSSKQFQDSRRGLGWDKPVQNDWTSPTSLWASPKTYGHTGFTGTCLWIDPEFDLVYIFLSNRVYPDRSNKLLNANIRSRIQDVIYRSIFDYCKEIAPSSTRQ
jgi:CubicO group peptidase (beta-lactamase class C family)